MEPPEGLLLDLGEKGALFALLVLAHAFLDYVALSSWMNVSRRKEVAADIVVGMTTYLICSLPGLSIPALPFVLGLPAWRWAVHALTYKMRSAGRAPIGGFVLDQALQIAGLIVTWRFLLQERRPELEGTETVVIHLALLGAALAFLARGGAWLVRKVLESAARRSSEGSHVLEQRPLGRTIGILERYVVLLLGVAGQWGAVGLVIAAKSVARFKDLEQREFSEYYLVGTLSSVLLAVGTVLALQVLAF